jgi:glutathione synthase/RimK-type ligase-like ATP-grasp enzyme
MKIAILANESRKKKDKPVLDEAEQSFDSVVYAPIKKVRFDVISKKTYNGVDLKLNGTSLSETDVVLTIPTNIHKELFYTALRMIDGPMMPFDAKTYMLTTNEELLTTFLSSHGMPTRKAVVVASNVSMDRINEKIKYPVIVRPPQKRIIVTNKQTLKDVISLYKYGTPIRIEAPIKSERNVWVFVLGEEVIAGYEKVKNASKVTAVDDDVKRLAIKVRRLVGCDYCAVRFLKSKNRGKWVFDKLTFSPDFANFQKITGVNVGRYMISRYLSKVEKRSEKPIWQKRVEEIFKRGKIK